MHSAIRIALVGDFNEKLQAHHDIPTALDAVQDGKIEGVWVPTESVGKGELLADFDGIWCTPGMPYHSAEGALAAIRYARVSRIPFLGTSAGFQYALIEYARNVLGFADADHQKSNPKAGMPLISQMDAAMMGVKARVRFTPGSVLHKVYRAKDSTEVYHCSFSLNNRYRRLMECGPLCVTAVDDHDEVRAVELDGHPFYVATLFLPGMHYVTGGGAASPLITAFATACVRRRNNAVKAAS